MTRWPVSGSTQEAGGSAAVAMRDRLAVRRAATAQVLLSFITRDFWRVQRSDSAGAERLGGNHARLSRVVEKTASVDDRPYFAQRFERVGFPADGECVVIEVERRL